MATPKEFEALFEWRSLRGGPYESAEALTEGLSCESLPWAFIPDRHRRTIVAFRHLRRVDRLAKVRRWWDGPER